MKYLFLVFALAYTAIGFTQNNISGQVTDTQNQPIPNAIIYIPKLEKGTVSDFDGNFTLNNIPLGTFTMVYSSLGYSSVSEKIKISEVTIPPISIQLEASAIEIDEVIISTPFHKLQRDNVMKVERETTSTLKKQGAITLADGITTIPGVQSITTGAGIGKPVIRGLSANRVLTYTQGVRLENQQFGDEHGLGVNGEGIESVEVIKGPASLLYGSDALGGVLYLNPEKFAENNTIAGSLNSSYFSNTEGTQTSLGVKASGEKLKFLARGTYASHSDYETGADYNVTNTRFNEKDFKAGARFQDTKLTSTLRYNYNRSNIGIPEELGAQNNDRELLIPFQEIDNHVLSWENNVYFNNSSLDIKAGYLFNDRREFAAEEEGEPAELELNLKLSTFNYDIKYNLPEFGRFETIVGVQGMFQENENFGEEILIPDAKVRDFGVFGTTHYHLDNVDIQAGLRFDTRSIESEAARDPMEEEFIPALNKDFTSFNAALGAKTDITKNLTARLNLASGFRAPNLAELTSNGVHEGTNRYEIGNANLDNEQNFQADLALEFGNEHVELIANGFYNAVSNYIFITPTGEVIEDNQVFDYVQSDASLYGGEFGFHLHPHPLDWLHLESNFETVTGQLKDDSYLPLIPANTLRNTLRVEFEKVSKLNDFYSFITLASTLDQENVSSFETRTGGYSLLSAGMGGNFRLKKIDFDLGLTVTNITNKTYVSHLSRLKGDGLLNQGRNVQVRLGVSL